MEYDPIRKDWVKTPADANRPIIIIGAIVAFILVCIAIGQLTSTPEASAQRVEQERRNRETKEIEAKLKEIQNRDGMPQSKELDERNRIFAKREAAKPPR